MFEITGNDISNLGDADLRELVKKLAIAELRAQGCPISSVTAGGHQDAPDGGLDVRIECSMPITKPDFVPRQITGYQVKKPDMPTGAIWDEMRPNNELREVIRDLADASGAYIILSAQGSVTYKALKGRRKAIKDALHDLTIGEQLYTDFYDRDRLASWVNEYPGVATWVRTLVGRPISGWVSISECCGGRGCETKPYLFNEKACLIDDCSCKRETLSILKGITRIRAELRIPGKCVRLIGLSGLGKTRLIQALFEDTVGEDALDPALALYTEFPEEGINPTAHEMARQLVQNGQRVILIIDNCNPKTHSELVKICSLNESKVSLITVEYDVRDDEPEQTEVFRLQSTDPELVAQWLGQLYPDISQLDRKAIADFSDGNFRVARAVAATLGKGETLGRLNNEELFERIFWQRNTAHEKLLRAAEVLSLLYSIDGENTEAEGELAIVGRLADFGASELYGALSELRGRGVVQARSRWRAVLPQVLANRLASSALKRIPPSDFDRFCSSLTPRMLKSVSRRLGYLHDSREAQGVVQRWLSPDGPLGDLFGLGEQGFEIIKNVAPVAPEAVLAKLEQELKGPKADIVISPGSSVRWQWIHLIKALAYDEYMFKTAALLLTRFVAAEPEEHNNNAARTAFSELFQFYFSGTQATPEIRRQIIKELAFSEEIAMRRCASIALDAHLKACHFSSMSGFDFGARSRDWGWYPKIYNDILDWYEGAISLALEFDDAHELLARHVRELWAYTPCQDALERTAKILSAEHTWIEGWKAFKAALRFEGKSMPEDIKDQLENIIARLKPTDLLNRARAVILGPGTSWDIVDGESDDNNGMYPVEKPLEMAKDIGRALAHDAITRNRFLHELLISRYPRRAWECGYGLADAGIDLDKVWRELVKEYDNEKIEKRNTSVLSGFIYGAHLRDAAFTSKVLDDCISNPAIVPMLPYLQAGIGLDDEGIARLRQAIKQGVMCSDYFMDIGNGSIDSPEDSLSALLEDISELPDGINAALNILLMRLSIDQNKNRASGNAIVAVGRKLLINTDFRQKDSLFEFEIETIIHICLSGNEGSNAAKKVCENIRSQMEQYLISSHDISSVLKALFEAHPLIALDTFLLPESLYYRLSVFDVKTPLEFLDEKDLRQWAERDRDVRYPLIGACLSMFGKNNDGENNELSPKFISMLNSAPDKQRFLGEHFNRIHPQGWSIGFLTDILLKRKAKLIQLAEQSNEEVKSWVDDAIPEIDSWIKNDRGSVHLREESFE